MWKIIRRVLIGLFLLIAAFAGLLFLLPSDVVTTRYESLAEARQANLVARGWLPDILPPSSHDITTSNNLDLNISEGTFSFAPADFQAFSSKTKPYTPDLKNPFVDFDKSIEEKRSEGYLVTTYYEEKTIWVFSCKPDAGQCEYTMWLERG